MKSGLSKLIYAFCSVLLSAALFSGCGSSKMSESTASSAAFDTVYNDAGGYYDDAYMFDGDMAEEAVEAEASIAGGTGPKEEMHFGSETVSRKLITTVHMTLEATDMDECMARLRAKTSEAGGYMEYESIERNYSSFTVRVPSDRLSSFLDAVKANSNVVSYSSNVEDVTLSYVDIESRIESLRTEQKRLDELLAGADTMEEIIALESRLSEVRYELASYESQRRTYDNRIDYSTVYININKVEVYTPEEEASVGRRISLGFSDSLKSLGDGLVDFGVWFVSSLPLLLFWSVILGGIFCAIFFPIRGRGKRRAKREAKRMAEAPAFEDEARKEE